MPKRVIQHEIEDISRVQFQLLLPRNWVYRDKSKDYGIDGEVEIFDDNKNPTGLVFWVQLKATESKKDSVILSVDFEIETLRYYKKLALPILLVRYSDFDKSIYTKWIGNVDMFFARKNAKTFRVKLSPDDVWSNGSPESIEAHLRKVRVLRSGTFLLPLPISIFIDEVSLKGTSSDLLLIQIKNELKRYSSFVFIESKEKAALQITLRKSELIINCSEISGCTFHAVERMASEEFPKLISQDLLLGISVCLMQLNHLDHFSRFIFETDLNNRLLQKKELLDITLPKLFESSYFEEALKLTERIISIYGNDFLSIVANFKMLQSNNSNNERRIQLVESFLKSRLQTTTLEGGQLQIGLAHYNLANHYSNRLMLLESTHHFNLARKFAPIYLHQRHFYDELAGVMFRSAKFGLAAKLYASSLKIEFDYRTIALRADSLMFSGAYKEALDGFDVYIKNTENAVEEFILKAYCLDYFLDKFGIDLQKRNEAGALEIFITKDSLSQEDLIVKALKLDFLCATAWFNLGIKFSKTENYLDASLCFAMAGLVNTGDIEAWKNSTMCGILSKHSNWIFTIVIRTAYFFNRENYLADLFSSFEKQNGPDSLSVFSNLVMEILPQNQSSNEMPTVRLLNESGKFESLVNLVEKANQENSG